MPSDDRLFDLDDIAEVPLFREPRRARAARGVALDSRFQNSYPPEWDRCTACDGRGFRGCSECLGMGSVKARVRLDAGHRCVRCKHPYIPKGDAAMLGVEPSGGRWSRCDDRCRHGALAVRLDYDDYPGAGGARSWPEAEWRILTVHHLDGDKANLAWWNLVALCQRCHLEIQAKVVLERVYPHEHTTWFQPFAAGWYAWVYEGREITREEAVERMDELLAYERVV